ncbi:hypothetical protein FPSE_00653 [Fusarium pseudograminearum CS3096]|uniref:Uncharacterized protein n=1 Tax=Fusarium pseudograminearum (strain CS3096) TaxID=1028729 RepID=K3VW63_FUSPC|nr:hypothetical protein FPSE_00653 [Fusarium pseudograminearum CS3096]EKJ79178.1 hypothetical protein FPSE_00653 [Fusarium pseudograminearum CS3096]
MIPSLTILRTVILSDICNMKLNFTTMAPNCRVKGRGRFMQDSSQLGAVLYSSDTSLDAPTPGIKQDS